MRQSESIPVLPASRAHALVAVLVAAGLAAAGAPDAAQAGSFRISACGPANATFTAAQNSPLYTVNQTCPKKDRPGAGTGLDVATASFGGLVGYFYSATWTVTAPPAAVFGQMSFNRYVQRVNENWTVALGADNGAGGGGVFLDGFAANDGSGAHDSAAWQPRVVNAGGRTRINAGVLCGNPSGCGTTIGQVRARYAIADVDLEVIDSTVPSVALGGPLTAGGWVGRQARLDVLGTDNVGIRMLSAGGGEQQKGLPISADNGKVPDPVLDLTCYYDRPKPCADINDYYNIDLTPLPDGPSQPFVVMAIDAANNFVRTAATINVDNTAPTAPLEVTVAGGDAWKQTNSFSVSWRNPVQSAAPIVAAAISSAAPSTAQAASRAARPAPTSPRSRTSRYRGWGSGACGSPSRTPPATTRSSPAPTPSSASTTSRPPRRSSSPSIPTTRHPSLRLPATRGPG